MAFCVAAAAIAVPILYVGEARLSGEMVHVLGLRVLASSVGGAPNALLLPIPSAGAPVLIASTDAPWALDDYAIATDASDATARRPQPGRGRLHVVLASDASRAAIDLALAPVVTKPVIHETVRAAFAELYPKDAVVIACFEDVGDDAPPILVSYRPRDARSIFVPGLRGSDGKPPTTLTAIDAHDVLLVGSTFAPMGVNVSFRGPIEDALAAHLSPRVIRCVAEHRSLNGDYRVPVAELRNGKVALAHVVPRGPVTPIASVVASPTAKPLVRWRDGRWIEVSEGRARSLDGRPLESAPDDVHRLDVASDLAIPLGEKITVGRNPTNDLVIASGQVSKVHCEIVRDGGDAFRVRDVGSTNGTWLDGRRIEGEVTLPIGASLSVGGITLRLRIPRVPGALSMQDLRKRADEERANGRPHVAIDLLREAAEASHDESRATQADQWRALATTLRTYQRLPEALAAARTCLRLRREDGVALLELAHDTMLYAELLRSTRAFDEALRVACKAPGLFARTAGMSHPLALGAARFVAGLERAAGLLVEDDDGWMVPVALRDRCLVTRVPIPLQLACLHARTLAIQHASFIPTDRGWILDDRGSPFGTWVDGHRVKTALLLREGQLIQFGTAIRARFVASPPDGAQEVTGAILTIRQSYGLKAPAG